MLNEECRPCPTTWRSNDCWCVLRSCTTSRAAPSRTSPGTWA
nr:hypothetical protein [Angustibacter aerolatus]